MKITKKNILFILTSVGLTLSGVSQAALIDKGFGLIYDDELDITWLQDANYAKTSGHDADGRMNWSNANAWAANLSYDGGIYGIIDDWRLTDVNPVDNTAFDYSFSYDGSTDRGYNIDSKQSEMGYMFYQNLGNTGYYDTSGTTTGCSGVDLCLSNTGLFDNLESYVYWSAVEYAPSTSVAWAFYTGLGRQDPGSKGHEFYAWAVRSGDVTASTVPEPGVVLLMASGLLGVVSCRKKR